VRSPSPILLVLFAVALGACGYGGSSGSGSSSGGEPIPTTVSPSSSPAENSLVGVWDTGRYTLDGMPWEASVRFYDEGGVPFVVLSGWNPTTGPMPQGGDHGPYKLLARNRIVFLSADQREIGTTYSYQLAGDELTLTFLHNDPDGPQADKGGPFTTLHFTRS
jgi:hypothetical protein